VRSHDCSHMVYVTASFPFCLFKAAMQLHQLIILSFISIVKECWRSIELSNGLYYGFKDDRYVLGG
jgi:hypothetical protein